MRILITTQPQDSETEPFPISLFRVGETYEVGPQLAARLVTAGYAASDNAGAANTSDRRDAHKRE